MYKVLLQTINMQPSDFFSEFGYLCLLYLWYCPNTLAKFKNRSPFLHFKPGRNSYVIAMFMDIMERLRAVFS